MNVIVGAPLALVDPLDRGAIAKGLVRLVSDGALRRRLAAAGRQRAAGFSWTATVAATWTSYREVVR